MSDTKMKSILISLTVVACVIGLCIAVIYPGYEGTEKHQEPTALELQDKLALSDATTIYLVEGHGQKCVIAEVGTDGYVQVEIWCKQ